MAKFETIKGVQLRLHPARQNMGVEKGRLSEKSCLKGFERAEKQRQPCLRLPAPARKQAHGNGRSRQRCGANPTVSAMPKIWAIFSVG